MSEPDQGPTDDDAMVTLAPFLARALDELDPDALHAVLLLGWLHWSRYQGLPEEQSEQELNAAISMLTPCFVLGVGELPEPLLPLLADEAGATAVALLNESISSSDQRLLSATTQLCHRILAATPADHPNRFGRLSNLGTALQTRYLRGGVPDDLDNAIDALREAVDAAPADNHHARPGVLSNLGGALQTRFLRSGVLDDLDSAIEAGRQAIAATPADDPVRAGFLSNLGRALRFRFEHRGALADLDAAVKISLQAVDAAPADHPERTLYLSNLGNALVSRYQRNGNVADLETAVNTLREAAAATPADHPDHASRLSDLAIALHARFRDSGVTADLDSALDVGREALDATPADHPNRPAMLSNLGNALMSRYERDRNMADLETAVNSFREAANAAPADDPNLIKHLFNLGSALMGRFERSTAQADWDAALQAHAQAASVTTAAPSARIWAGRAAAPLAAGAQQLGLAADLAEEAVRLLPEVAPRHLEPGDQRYAIGTFAGLASEAASIILEDQAASAGERAVRALRLLEIGRGVLLSQALHTRNDLTDLRERHPHLATRFVDLRDLLDQPPEAFTPDPASTPLDDPADALRRTIQDRRHLAGAFTDLLAEIRGLEGFGSFALPPATEQLLAQAVDGPVVVFNISVIRSDALLLTVGGVTSLRLPGLDEDTVIDMIDAFRQALRATGAPGPRAARILAQTTIRQILEWLWENATGPVLDALGYHRPPPPGRPWPRVWWVPGGLLGQLPIHAAGHHTRPADPRHRTVMDRVVSSYTPTIGALAHARAQATTPLTAAARSLIVAMPTTPGLPGDGLLPQVPAEAAMLRTRLPNPMLLTEPATPGDAPADLPTKNNVLAHLLDCAIVHFACHGYTDPSDPSASRLLLHDHHNDPLTVAGLAPVALDHAHLAYLSACSTAVTAAADLLDEAIHLSSAFQLAGFPHVIGTLWQIDDEVAVTVADAFYATLATAPGVLETRQAAHALHHAIRTIRDRYPITPSLWASHIHAGA
ncbi:CHAT domain-containing protein [Streptosporangium sp. LJ11]|uniref:CHAT domain-containing protein n=1 Tax=Streptosporangium sp. LJ11 TaxID=3436927 RepID=UPI003F7B0465